MKAIFIIFNPALEGMIMDRLKTSGAVKYTKIPYMLGEGGHSEAHLDTHIWPGSNIGILAVVDDEKAKMIISSVKEIKKEYLTDGVKAFVLPIEEEI
ncbi:MAG: hypothetical protein NT030_05905 [Candidatus Saganbacteria bacterium]|nr:hypothetical protein [Candidatus Saganbacteria bacterium]